MSASSSVRRCAIYTRKSSEEGLEQDFNSLQAQRESCEAFILSQRSEGWQVIEAHYDDGGFSGGSMQRPALQRLLADIKERRLDTIVVYKVDRLTRSLSDFAKMVEVFDAHAISFVAVTQQFNTTTSMGRLTLNVLLSFAQFEREVTGERIRDKIAASKRKGMWMGGNLPLGYDAEGRKLIINPVEAETVRHIFRRYLALGCTRRLKDELDRDGIVSKRWVAKGGRTWGGHPMSRSALYFLINNPVYIGVTRHKRTQYPGQHEAILDRDLWDAVQAQIAANRGKRSERPRTRQAYPLLDKLFDANGGRLVPVYSGSHGRKYRYYVSPALTKGADDESTTWRLSAPAIERAVAEAAIAILSDSAALATALREAGTPASAFPIILADAEALRERGRAGAGGNREVFASVTRVEVAESGLTVTIQVAAPTVTSTHHTEPATPLAITRRLPMTLRRRGVEMRIVVGNGSPPPQGPDPALLKIIARGWRWFEELASGEMTSMGDIAEREGITDRYVGRLIRLAFLAPEMVEAVVKGRQPAEWTAEHISEQIEVPLMWNERLQMVSSSGQREGFANG